MWERNEGKRISPKKKLIMSLVSQRDLKSLGERVFSLRLSFRDETQRLVPLKCVVLSLNY